MAKFVLRNYPDDDALNNAGKYSKALSFSPDIIPLYGTIANRTTLIGPTSWRGFTGMPLVGGDDNNIYVRGHGSGGPYASFLRALPSELILWPQVWQDLKPVSGPVAIQGGDTIGHYVADGPIQFRQPHTTGNAYSLVANVFKHVPGQEEPLLHFDPKTFGVDEFISFLSENETHTFYNVIVADPTLKHVSATTRLRMMGSSPVQVHFSLDWHKGTPVPEGLEVSLVDDRGKIVVPRTPFSRFGERPVLLESSYDGILLLNIFSAADGLFEPYSGLSLQVFRSQTESSPKLLGALNIIFEHHSTRNLRFASPAWRNLTERGGKDQPEAKSIADEDHDCGPLPITSPQVTGWWTRVHPNDTNNFPRGNFTAACPDIQAVGTDPSAKDFLTILRDPDRDYSAANNVELVGDQNNYIYLRGYSTTAGIDVQSRLFAVGANPVNHPSQYLTQGLQATVLGSDDTVNELSISTGSDNGFYVFDKPFVIADPPKDATNHYCFIAEFRQKRKCSPVWPAWPSDHWANYATLGDFWNYLLTTPFVCWRNINWEPAQPGGKKCWSWTCSTNLVLPDISFYSTFWTFIVECENSEIPPGCTWSLVCDDNKLFPNGICFQNQPVSTRSPASAGCHFTGAPRGYSAKVTLTLTWCDGGDQRKIPPPRVNFRLASTESLTAPLTHLAAPAPAGHEKWPLYVTNWYPYFCDHPHPSPLPSFKNAGVNVWPFKSAPQFTVGHVLVAAKPV